ncbi:MAG: hypothetical protein E7069_09340 [Bacteroidales bacterium]|jgi:hypothetical protein|nr:hypothetical protein [Bacteroidales bacterium]
MKTSKIFAVAAILLGLAMPIQTSSQEDIAEITEKNCKEHFQRPFILTGRPFRALITDEEVAEFRATFLSGVTYRIATGNAGNNYVQFALYDGDHNLIFTNTEYENAPYWDFSLDGYMECIVEATLDKAITSSGFVILMTGFKID